MENYSLLMGAAAVMKMAVEMAAVSMEKPSGHFPAPAGAGTETPVPQILASRWRRLWKVSVGFVQRNRVFATEALNRRKGSLGGGLGPPHHRAARPSLWPRQGVVWGPQGFPLAALVLDGSGKNRNLGVDFVRFREYFVTRISETKNSRKQELALRHLVNRIDPALAFRLVVRLDSSFTRDSKRLMNGFYFPAVVATTISLRDLKANIFDKYSWSSLDAVHFEYFNSTERRLVPLISDDDLGILFALNASCHFGKIRVHVDRGQASSGVGASSGGRASCLSTAAASANSVRRGDPCRSTAAPSVPSASGSQIVPVVNVEDDAEIGDQSPEDDEDELMFPELVDRCSKQAMEDQYMEDIAFGARFDETDDEEKNENDDSLVLADYEGEDLPTIEWNRENPQLAKGTVFQTMMDCRNAITTYHILTKNNYEVIKSEPDQAGAENAEENEAAIQLEIEAAVQHEEIEAANAEEIEAAVQHEEIEAANAEEIEAAVQHEEIEAANAEEIEAAVQHEEIEPMDREQREQMDVEWLQPMSPEESQQYYRHCLDSCKAMCDAHFEELMAEEKAEASQKKKNKKEGKRKVDTGNIPGRVTRSKVVAPASHTRSKKKILF
ncbi:hypothetical protein QYE76_041591 [Lolium multiflorum]|uniref:Uncharacterized protein n=1 Tax=Lolium multiflorum TaxID=4521 RepID=A0AAD8TF24_LOLMU|nr:hypothetical protein QYE76_041591 [Lolium multiflorum]